jgi:hypothetical protein
MKERFQIDRLKIGATLTSRQDLFQIAVEGGQRLLQQARLNHAQVQCLCNGDDKPLFMAIVDADRFHIRRLPNQGSKHHQQCLSYGGINERAAELYTEEAIVERGDNIHISLDGPLSEKLLDGFKDDEEAIRNIRATASVRRYSMTILGLLNYLWEEANLNIWWPRMDKRRGSWVVRSEVLKACEGRLFKGGRSLRQFVFIPEAARDRSSAAVSKNAGENHALLLKHLAAVKDAGADNEACYGIVIGEIARLIDPTAKQRSAGLVLRDVGTPLWDNHGVIKRLDERFTNAMGRLRKRQAAAAEKKARPDGAAASTLVDSNDYRLIGIFAVGLGKNGESVVLKQAAVMETSTRYVPLASDYEGQLERKLYREGRAFLKPLVYDGERWSFPDFVLIDTDMDPKPVLEVYGYSGDEYEARKREKHVEYVRTRTPYWYWDLKMTKDIPSLGTFPRAQRFNRP